VEAYDANKAPNGSVVETCWYFVPGFDIKAPDGTVEYKLSMVRERERERDLRVSGLGSPM